MSIIINLIVGIIFVAMSFIIYSGQRQCIAHPVYTDKQCLINKNLSYLVFCIATSMVFLGPFSLVKYGFWILFMAYLALKKFELKIDVIVKSYLLFLGWLTIMFIVSSAKFTGLMVLIKYALPLLYLWLGYSAIDDEFDLIYFLKASCIIMVIYACLIGGVIEKIFQNLYILLCYTSGGLMISYAALADFFSSMIVAPICLFVITKKRIWLFVALWVSISTIAAAVRTGIGGLFLATSFFLLCYYKLKSLPWLFGLIAIGIGIVFFVPSIHEKMFINESTSLYSFNASQDVNFDNIRSNGREAMWDINLNHFYKPHPITGSGLGVSNNFVKNNFKLKLIHNDYVQILCDSGLIGIVLFGIFVVTTFFKVLYYTFNRDKPQFIKLAGSMAIGSCAATFFSMCFDNVVTYAQQSFVIPFIFIGIFLKSIDLNRQL